MKKILLLLAAVGLIFTSVAPVSIAADEGAFGRGINTTHVLYDNTNGLPTSEANAIAQTSDGFIWIGSYSGLIRYDGNDFYRFDASTGVASVVCLFVDSKDRLWIGTNDSGVAKYEKGEFTFFNKNEGLKSSSIRSIAEDKDGDILIATTQGMAYVTAGSVLHALDEPQLNDEYIKQLRTSENGDIYGVTVTGGVFVFDGKRVTSYISSENSGQSVSINCVCPDPENPDYVYLGTDLDYILHGDLSNGLKNAKKISTGTEKSINDIEIYGDRTWVCADNGIGRIDENGRYSTLTDISLNNSIDDMLVDHEGNYWFVSSRQGVMKIVEDQFLDVSKKAGMEAVVVNSTCYYKDCIYLGTDTGLRILDKNYNELHNELTEKLDGVRIRCITKDASDALWFSTYSGDIGVLKYAADGTISQIDDSKGLLSNWVRSTRLLSDGRLAVAASGGLNIIENDEVTETYDASNGIKNTEILTICEGPKGELYLGSDGDGIYVLENGIVSRIGEEDGLPAEVILRIKYDPLRDVYWVITSSSLAMMKDGHAEKIHEFPYSNNFDLVYDDDGNIWILSSNGIYVVDGEQMVENGELEYRHFDSSSGLGCVATANSWSDLTDDGTLYIAGSTGVSAVNINEIEDEAKSVDLAVPCVSADDKMLYVENGYVEIPRDCQRLTIYGYALTFSLKNPKISYTLSGFDDEVYTTTKQELSPVSYTNLSGGRYEFTMSIINTMDNAAENTITIRINKEKYIYEYALFWVIIVLFSLAAIIIIGYFVGKFIGKKRSEAAERKTKENQEFVDQTISAFAKLIDAKDKYTQGHSRRVAEYTKKLAIKLGYDEEEVRKCHNIALLHDIGKVAIPDAILNKPEGLNDDEYEIMKSHAQRGKEILEEIKMDPDLALGAGYHHERFDGKGYPQGLQGDDIPQIAQLIAVADTFDAMYSTRPYRKQLPLHVVLGELRSIAGTQLNEEYVKAFLELAEAGELVNLEEAERRAKQAKEENEEKN